MILFTGRNIHFSHYKSYVISRLIIFYFYEGVQLLLKHVMQGCVTMLFHHRCLGTVTFLIFILELSVLHKSCLELNLQAIGTISRVPCTPVFLRSHISARLLIFQCFTLQASCITTVSYSLLIAQYGYQ